MPFPFFQVYVPVRLPFFDPAGGGVNAEVAPAARAAGVQLESTPVDLPFLSGGELSLAQVADCGSAADADIASGSVSASPVAASK